MMNKLPIILTATLLSSHVHAVIELTDTLSFSGFGSTSWARSDNDTPLFINRFIKDENCFDCDTTFGLQLDYYNNGFKASVQGVKRPQDHWSNPSLEWAYVGYEFDNFDIRVGRQRLPLYLASEYFYVGQAYTLARLPTEVYGAFLGITGYNGIAATWNTYIGDELQLTVTPYVGFDDKNSVTFSPTFELEFETQRLYGINAQLLGDFYRWNFSVMDGKFDVTSRGTGFADIPFPPYEISFPIDSTDENTVKIYSIGTEYEFDMLKATFEFQKTESRRMDWYSMLSYRLAPFTPYVAYGQLYQEDKRSNMTTTLGVRYDVLNNVSINAEYQYVKVLNDGSGAFAPERTISPDVLEDNTANLFTIMVNFVF